MTVRIGFIGAGGIAGHHMNILQRVEGAKITAMYDLSEARAKEMAEKYDATVYDSVESLLDSGNVDAVFICTPPFARQGEEVLAASRGIAVLAEKPVGLDMEVVKQWEEQVVNAGVIHTSGYCLRYQAVAQKAKAYLEGKKISLIQAYRLGGLPPVAWWKKQDLSGGQLVEQSTHQLDLIRYLAGDFASVHAIHAHTHLHEVDADATVYDVGVVSFTMRSGAIGNINSSVLAERKGRGEIEIYGPDFFLSIDMGSLHIVDAHQNITEVIRDDFYYLQDKAFVEAVATKNQDLLLADYTEAVETLRVTLAANESAASGQTVQL